jgi:hypothetical protein
MRWFITRTRALPVKLLLLAWLLYAVVVSALGSFVKIAAAAKVTMAVFGVFLTAVAFPLLCALIIGAVILFGTPLIATPRLWHSSRPKAAKIALTLVLVVGTAVAGTALQKASVWAIGWIADRDPCAALRAGVTGSKPPWEADCPSPR